jgi:hypothetical protein
VVLTALAEAAQGDPAVGRLILIGLGLAWLGGYAVACWLWPYTSCHWCSGRGVRVSPSGKRYGTCRHCKGKRVLRLGRRIWNFLAH